MKSEAEINRLALHCLASISREMGGLVASKSERLRGYWRFLDDVGKKIIILHYGSRNSAAFGEVFPNAIEERRVLLQLHTEKHLDSIVSDTEFVSFFEDLFSEG